MFFLPFCPSTSLVSFPSVVKLHVQFCAMWFVASFQSLLSALAIASAHLPMAAEAGEIKYIMYLTGQHNVVPQLSLVSDVTHVALAFMRSGIFNEPNPTSWPLFTTIEEVRPKFKDGTKIMVAIGGWGDTDNFATAARSEESRQLFAENIKRMLDATGADGVDVDWEYPGGNGEDYKTNPNPTKEWEIRAYPALLSAIRTAIGPDKLISAAVPGIPRDMLAFTASTLPSISKSVDFLNIMTYDLMNRRDNITKHHTGIAASLEAIDAYLNAGLPPAKANLGLAFYIKWFKTDPNADCKVDPVGCKTMLLEDPNTGTDLGGTGQFSWHDEVPSELAASFSKAMENGEYDPVGGGHYYFDDGENLWWSWDTPEAIGKKFPVIVERRGLGGVFAWGLGEDAPKFEHLKAANAGLNSLARTADDKLEERSEL